MKRLLCILDSLNAGGAETFLMKLYRSLDKTEYQMDFVVCGNGIYDKEVLDAGGRLFKIPLRTKHFFKAFNSLKKIVKENGYQNVLKLGSSPIVAFDLFAVKLGGAKQIALRSCNAPTHLSTKQKLINRFLRPAMNRLANIKIAPSDLAARYTFGDKLFEEGKVTLLHNALDLSIYRFSNEGRVSVRDEFGLGDSLVIGHIGRFSAQKNHVFLLDIFAKIKAKRPDAKLLLIGEGPLQEKVRQKSTDLGLSDSVIFAGVRRDVPALLSAMDVFVFPSFYEGMPNTVIEAQAADLPALITDTITKGAKVTDLVDYLPLSASAEEWATNALSLILVERKDTSDLLRASGYAIEDALKQFIELCFA